jgi:hypothetical protein
MIETSDENNYGLKTMHIQPFLIVGIEEVCSPRFSLIQRIS